MVASHWAYTANVWDMVGSVIVDKQIVEALAGSNQLNYLFAANRKVVIPHEVEIEMAYNWANNGSGVAQQN